MTDPGRSGGEGTGQTGWHRHPGVDGLGRAAVHQGDAEGCGRSDGTPVIVLDQVTARDTIARALWMRSNPRPPDWDAWPEWDRNGFLADADAVIAALASQERGE